MDRPTRKQSYFSSWLFGEKRESEDEFHERMKRESEQREAERQRKKLEDQRKKEKEKSATEERRRIVETESRLAVEIEEFERRKTEEERARRSKEQLERRLRMQREETSRQLEEQRIRADVQRAREEREYQERQRKLEEESRKRRELREKELEMERRNEADRLYSMQQLHQTRQIATSSLSAAVAAAASESAAANERAMEQLAAENESQRLLNLRTEQIQKELERAAIEEKQNTSMFVKGVDDSIQENMAEMRKKEEEQMQDSRVREAERTKMRLQYMTDMRTRQEKEKEELREKNRLYEDSSQQMRRDAEMEVARNEEELDRLREAHAIRVEELLLEEKRRMEELNQMKKEKEEGRRMNWNRMRESFVLMMRNRYAGMMNNEMENKWDDRFNQLRRSSDPVKEAFSDLEGIPLRKSDVATSLITFEAHLESLGMSLNTLEEIMTSEHEQVEIWKRQQTGAHFLADFGSALETILGSVDRVRKEIKMVDDGIEINRENAQKLDEIFELRYLEERMMELADAMDSIPSVYELNKKYGL